MKLFKKHLFYTLVLFIFFCSFLSCWGDADKSKEHSKETLQSQDLDSIGIKYSAFLESLSELGNYKKKSRENDLNIFVFDDSIAKMTPGLYASEIGKGIEFVTDSSSGTRQIHSWINLTTKVNDKNDVENMFKANLKLANAFDSLGPDSMRFLSAYHDRSFLVLPQLGSNLSYTGFENIEYFQEGNPDSMKIIVSEISDTNIVFAKTFSENSEKLDIKFNSLENDLWEQIKFTYPEIVGEMTYEELLDRMDYLKNSRIEYEWESDSTVGDINLKIENRGVDIREKEIEGIDIPLHGKLKCELEIDGGFGTYSFKVTKVFFNDDTEGKIKMNPRKIKSAAQDDPYETFIIIISEK